MPSSPVCDILPWQERQWGMVTSNPRLGHALLLAGPMGVGKTRFAEALSRRLLCDSGSGCDHCRSCRLVRGGNHPDLMRCGVAPGKTEIPIDDIRELTTFLTLKSHTDRGRVAIIIAAERLNRAAANALLKSLEEPPDNTHLLLVSHAPERLLPTVRSRCQRLEFPLPAEADSLRYLEAAGCAEPQAALTLVAGAPLRAAAVTATDLRLREDLLKALEAVRAGRLDPLAAAESWYKADTEAAFAVLTGLLARAVGCIPAGGGESQASLSDRLQALVGGLDFKQVFAFWDAVLDRRERLDAPLDRHLIWDEVFLIWQQISRHTE